MVRAMTPARALLISIGGGIALALTLIACDPTGQAPANPMPGQTWRQPGNDDLCVWTTDAGWREVDDGEPCEDGDHVHWSSSTRRPLVSTARTTSTRKVVTARPTARRSTSAARPTSRRR